MISLVYGDDWMGVYVDGECVYQDHSVQSYRLLEIAGIQHEVVHVDLNWLENEGALPQSINDVVREENNG